MNLNRWDSENLDFPKKITDFSFFILISSSKKIADVLPIQKKMVLEDTHISNPVYIQCSYHVPTAVLHGDFQSSSSLFPSFLFLFVLLTYQPKSFPKCS